MKRKESGVAKDRNGRSMTDASLFTGEEEYGMGFERASLLKDG